MSLFLLAVGTLWQREIVRFYRQPSRVVGALAPPVLFWLLIGSGLGASFHAPGVGPGPGTGAGAGATSYLAWFFPGVVILILLFTAIFSEISIIEDRREGFLQGVLVSPAPRVSVILGKVLGGTTLALLQSALFLLLAPAAGLPLPSAGTLAALLLVLFLLAFTLTALAAAIAWRLDSSQGFHAIMNLFLIPMWLLGGTLFPLAGAPGWLGVLMRINPLTYGVAALRHSLAPAAEPGLPALGVSLGITVGCAILAFAAAAWVGSRRPAR
jgi:ABC-2 type transport system permease protein